MNGILLVQRTFTYHGNLIGKSCVTCLQNSKSRITLLCPVLCHAAILVSITLLILGQSCVTQKPFATLMYGLVISYIMIYIYYHIILIIS